MARRIINKACNDLVGGAGTGVSVSIGPEIPRKSSVLKLSSKDVSHGNRQAVEVKPAAGRQLPKGPLQIAHPSKRDNLKQEEIEGKPRFVSIDGDGSVKQVDAAFGQPPKAVPQTAYKMRSFISTVELGPRGQPRTPTQANQNPMKPPPPPAPPRREPNLPKVSNQAEITKMLLPKGIHQTDQPYVAPKFMPSYREMMVPKPKPDPLVSIVEATPPSLQKWAVEWNAEPKKTISIDELKEDLIREASEKSPKPASNRQQTSFIHELNPDEVQEDGKSEYPNNNPKNRPHYVAPMEKTYPNSPEGGNRQPWNDFHVPTSYETRMENQAIRNPEPKQQKIGQPLVDWVPPKYSGSNRFTVGLNDPPVVEYSFQEAINNGKPKKTALPESAAPKIVFPKSAENVVYFDTEEQKFHEWFKEKMSAAVHSTVNQPSKVMPKNNKAQIQVPPSDANTFPAARDSSDSGNMPPSADLMGENQISQAERNPLNNINQSNSWKDLSGALPAEVRAHRKPTNNAPATEYKPESNSSFYQWLKSRGHYVAKSEPNPPEIKKEPEKTSQPPQNAPLFPWSMSYTVRKRASTPAVTRKRVSAPTAVAKRPRTAKYFKKFQTPVSQDETTLKAVKNSVKRSMNSIGRNSIKSSDRKSLKTIGKRSVKSAGKKPLKSDSKVHIKNAKKETLRAESIRAPASAEHSWLSDSWNVSSEIDHVNNLRKMEVFGNGPKGTKMKKLFPSLGGHQMKYWESKYMKKPGSVQNQKVTQAVDNAAKTNSYNWLMPKKTVDENKNVFKEVLAVNSGNDCDKSSNFAAIDEYSSFPLKLPQNSKDGVMDFSEDFDVDSFLYKEEAVEKELVDSTHEQENKVEAAEEKTENEQSGKMKGKEKIKFPRTAKAPTEANNSELSLKQRLQQKLDDDDFVLALGEDPGQEDLEWSEFIGPRNTLMDHDGDLTRLIGAQARQLGAVQRSCL